MSLLETLMKKDKDIEKLSKSVEQLRLYIGEVKPNDDEEKLKNDILKLTNDLKTLIEENNTLHSTVELLNVRLAAISEIVSTQEAEITRHDSNGRHLACCVEDKGLLSTWRGKVFSLMVQLRTQRIVDEETKRKEAAKVCFDLNEMILCSKPFLP